MNSFPYIHDAPFWHLLAYRALQRAQDDLPPLFESLSHRACDLELPIVFSGKKSLFWAVICQLFVVYNSNAEALARRDYLRMISGFKRAFEPRHFPQTAFKRIIANITYPAAPDRTVKETVADTFLANGLTVTDGYDDSSWDDVILSRSLEDSEMMSLCDRIVTPPGGLWESSTEYYARHRPGFFDRLSLNAKNWLID